MTAETVMSRPRRAALLAALLLAAAPAARGAVLNVTKPADTLDGVCDSDCSLREAVVAANARNGRDVIVLPPGFYRLSRAGAGEDHAATGDLDVRYPLTVIGAGADKTVIDGGGLDRVFDALGASLELLGVAVQGGRVAGWGGGIRSTGELGVYQTLVRGNAAVGETGEGGGIWVEGDLVMHESTVAENLAQGGIGGGGILTLGEEALLNNSTISGNEAEGQNPEGFLGGGFGGGLFAGSDDVIVSNTTITGNTAAVGGGYCVFSEDAPSGGFPTLPPGIGLRNSILAGNSADAGPDCSGSYTSDGYNLIGNNSGCQLNVVSTGNLVGTPQQPIDPRLGPLADNGGPTPTHALLPGSPALDAGSPKPFEIGTAYCQAVDQRGQTRSVDGDGDGAPRCDMGAVEQSAACISGGGVLCLQGGRFRLTTRWTTPGGGSGDGRSLALTPDSGSFWFFDPGNIELTVKVLNGCALNDRYWVFAAGLTNLEVTLVIEDTATGAVRTYDNPPDAVYAPILDTAAFPCD